MLAKETINKEQLDKSVNNKTEGHNSVNNTKVDAEDVKEGKPKAVDPSKGRRLGDEWAKWDGASALDSVDSPRSIFLYFAIAVLVLTNLVAFSFFYLIQPRLAEFSSYLPTIVMGIVIALSAYMLFWYFVLLITSYGKMNLHFLGKGNRVLIGFLLDKVFRLGDLLKYNKDKLGNSFIKVSNEFVRKTKNPSGKERLLLLLPRCLTKESYQTIKEMGKEFGVEVAVCTGGEIARKKVKEFRPSAVIGVACERDLVSGIKDVGSKVSVLGIPNIRPQGPCKNTHIDYDALRSSIQFYLS